MEIQLNMKFHYNFENFEKFDPKSVWG
jgi:hypothetical protein